MNSHRKPNETMRDYFKRDYAHCMERVEKYYVLQSLRRDQGYFGAALFYQHEAKRWHERAMECRYKWLISSWRVIGLDHAKPGADRCATFIPAAQIKRPQSDHGYLRRFNK